jgi:deoxycytidylate deaminase
MMSTKPTPMLALPPGHENDCICDEHRYVYSKRKALSKNVQHYIDVIEALFVKPVQRHTTNLHVAFIVKRGKIISAATNSIGSRQRGCGYNDRTIHAEMAALKKVDWRELDGADMYIFRWRSSVHDVAYSHPCYNCSMVLNKCIKQWGLNRIYYSVDPDEYENNGYAERSLKGKKLKSTRTNGYPEHNYII